MLLSVLFFSVDPLLFSKNLYSVKSSKITKETKIEDKDNNKKVEDSKEDEDENAEKFQIKEEIEVNKDNLDIIQETEKKLSSERHEKSKTIDEANISVFAVEVRAKKDSFMRKFCDIILCPVSLDLLFRFLHFLA